MGRLDQRNLALLTRHCLLIINLISVSTVLETKYGICYTTTDKGLKTLLPL